MISCAVASYHDVYNCYPPAFIADDSGTPIHSWRVLILPFMDEQKLYAEYDFDEPWNGPNNSKLTSRRPRTYLLHGVDDPGGSTSNYLAVVGKGTVWEPGRNVTHKELASTREPLDPYPVAVVENLGSGISWMEPRDLNFETMSFSLKDNPADGISSWLHPPAVVGTDGAVRSLDTELSAEELRSMFLRDFKGEVPNGTKELTDGRDRPRRGE